MGGTFTCAHSAYKYYENCSVKNKLLLNGTIILLLQTSLKKQQQTQQQQTYAF